MTTALYQAHIYRQAGQFAEALLIEDGRIVMVGTNQEILEQQPDQRIDCQGQTLIPGFNDSHSHLMMVSANRRQVQLLDSSSIAEVLQRGKDFLTAHPDLEVLTGMGWNPADFTSGETRNLTRYDLDAISRDIPILFTRACAHMVACNTKALELAGIDHATPEVPGGVFEIDQDGPIGTFYENAQRLLDPLIPTMTPADMALALRDTMTYALSLGITTVQTNDLGFMLPIRDAIAVYRDLYTEAVPAVRTVHQMCFDNPSDLEQFLETDYHQELPDLMRFGPLKLFKDGTLGGRSAMVSDSYLDQPGNFGVDVLPLAQAKPLLKVARRHGLQVISHCIGDRAMTEMMSAYQPLSPDQRWGLVHCQITRAETLQAMKQVGVTAIIQPIFLRADISAMAGVIDPAIQQTSYAWKQMLELGIPIAIGTDSPIEDLNPFANLYCAITRHDPQGRQAPLNPSQALTVEQAVDGYTWGSAYAEFQDHHKGRLEPGFLADMVLLDRDIFSIRPEDLLQTKVLKTWVAGRIVYEV